MVEDGMWEHEVFCSVLEVSGEASSERVMLSCLQEAQCTRDLLDVVLIERLGLPAPAGRSYFGYLVRAYERALQFASPSNEHQRESARLLSTRIAAYAGMILLSDLEMIRAEDRKKCIHDLRVLLAADPHQGRVFPSGFLRDLVSSLESISADSVAQVFEPIISGIAKAKTGANLTLDNFVPALRSLEYLASVSGTADLISSHPDFIPSVVFGRDFEFQSLLGRYFSLMEGYECPEFADIRMKTRAQVETSMSNIRSKVNFLCETLEKLCFGLVKAGTKSRDALLTFFVRSFGLNKDRAKMRFNPHLVASEKFFLNIARVVVGLCSPFTKSKAKMNLISVPYWLLLQSGSLVSKGRIDFSGQALLGATADDVQNLMKDPSLSEEFKDPFNFATEIFFLAHALLNIGLIRSFQFFEAHLRQISQQQQALQRLTGSTNPRDQEALEAENRQVDRMYSAMLVFRTQILNPDLLESVAMFYQWTASLFVWFMHNKPELLKFLPEFLLSDLADFFIEVGKFEEHFIRRINLDDLLSFLIEFISPSSPLKNPHLRSKLPEILVMFLPTKSGSVADPKTHVFNTHPKLRDHLIEALVDLYVAVEYTGRSNQFYEKFSSRHLISELMEFCWTFEIHRIKFREICRADLFANFINALTNDAIWLLDQSIESLVQIRNTEIEMTDSASWRLQPFEVQREREEAFAQSEGSCAANWRLANEQVRMMAYLTGVPDIAASFLSDDFLERMAQMIDYYIVQLLGPQISSLKVSNPEKYNFEPRKLLVDIISIFLNFSLCPGKHDAFLEAVVKDERSYKPEVFRRAVRLLSKKRLLSSERLNAFAQVVEDLQVISSSVQSIDELLADAPDHFLDPLVSSIMRDPVILPGSKITIDRSVITRHLLNTSSDPFNRQPLKAEDLVPNEALKKEIDAWMEAKLKDVRAHARIKAQAEAAKEAMSDEKDDDEMKS